MARSQFTFTFPNAQPGAAVTFSAAVYSSPVDAVADGPTLPLDSQRTVAVWTDAAELTATWVDGAGASITAEASADHPVVAGQGGVPGTPPPAASSVGYPCWFANSAALATTEGDGGGYPLWAPLDDGVATGTDVIVDSVDHTLLSVVNPGIYWVTMQAKGPQVAYDALSTQVSLNDDSIGPAYWVSDDAVGPFTAPQQGAFTGPPTFPLILAAGDTLRLSVTWFGMPVGATIPFALAIVMRLGDAPNP